MCAYARVYVRVCVIVFIKLLALQLSDLFRHTDITILLQGLNEYHTVTAKDRFYCILLNTVR